MWNLLKAEISYNRIYLLIAYCIAIPTLILFLILEGGIYRMSHSDPPVVVLFHQILLMTVVFPLVIGIAIDRKNTKRARLNAQLISPIRGLGLIYMSIPILFWLSIVFLYWLFLVVGSSSVIKSQFIWQTVALTGFMFFAAGIALYPDLKYCLKRKSEIHVANILGPVIGTVLALLYYASIMPQVKNIKHLNAVIPDLGSSPVGAIVALAFGILMAVLGIVIVGYRKSYTE
jgi:hypothetical protein